MRARKAHEHRWVSIKPGFPQKICKCGYLKVGTNTVLLSDFVRYSSPKAPVAEGDIGMAASGRPQFFRAAAVRDVAGLDDITTGPGAMLARTVFSGGNYVLTGAEADVPDGVGFVEVSYAAPGVMSAMLDVDCTPLISQPIGDVSVIFNISVNTVVQAFVKLVLRSADDFNVYSDAAAILARFSVTLAAGANTIRLRAYQTGAGGGGSATIIKSASNPTSLTLWSSV